MQKDGTIWEWEETPELLEALKQYNEFVVRSYQDNKSK